MIIDRLQEEAMRKSPICIGLDTSYDYLTKALQEKSCRLSEKIFEFNRAIIDRTDDLAACYKLQIAYYEAMGMEGLRAYRDTLSYLRDKGILSIGDVKRGDILATQAEYAKAHLTGEFEADFVTLNAYMGQDAVSPFYPYIEHKEKGVFVLLHTSNSSAGDLQELSSEGKEVYLHMGDLLEKWGKNYIGESGFSGVGAVAGLTYPKEFEKLSELYPKMFFLIPGYGAQGGRGEDLQPVFRNRINGVVNSSRGIIAAHKGKTEGMDFADYAREAVQNMKEDLIGWR